MKQLKFMLAAATAIGLATAAQAARFSGSTDFEGNFDLANGFTFNGTAGDNESAIIPEVPTGVDRPANHGFTADQANVLQVNTGTEPIVRSVNGTSAGASLAGGDVYVDTLVQFTVTPKDDVPTVGSDDKLQIYLKEMLVNDRLQTNLVARAAKYDEDKSEWLEDGGEFVLSLPIEEVIPGQWYRLVVKAIGDITGENDGENYFPGFQVFIGGAGEEYLCNVDGPGSAFEAMENCLLSLQADPDGTKVANANIKAVGFAGEGKVDDLVISTFDPTQTVVDFTLALDDTVGGISGKVTYSCNAQSGELSGSVSVSCYTGDTVTVSYSLKSETEYSASWTGATVANNAFEVTGDTAGDTITLVISKNAPSTVDFTFMTGTGVTAVEWTINGEAPAGKVKAGDVIKITDVDYVDLYVPGTVAKGYEKTITADEVAAGVAISVTVDAKPLTGEGAVAVPEGTTAAQIGVDTGTTGLADASATELTAIVKWADTFKTGSATAIETVNSMVFDGKEPKNEPAEAFLLNCSVADLATKKGEFKFEDFDASNVDNWLQSAIEELKGKYQNGNVVPQRAQNLGVWYGDDDDKPEGFAPKFFRAKLIRK